MKLDQFYSKRIMLRYGFVVAITASIVVSSSAQQKANNNKEENKQTKSEQPNNPPPPPEEEKVFIRSERMPRFPGCEDMPLTDVEKSVCAKEKLMEYIHSKIKYSELARTNKVEGIASVRFVVGIDGTIRNITLLKDPGFGVGEAVLEVVESMNSMTEKWICGKMTDRFVPVPVYYSVSIDINLK